MPVVGVVFAGLGGHGVLTAAEVLATAALLAGHDVKKSEVHGMAQRGGSVTSHVRYGESVRSPLVPLGTARAIVGTDEVEAERNRAYLAPDGIVIVPTDRLRSVVDNPRVLNTALLGALSVHLDIPAGFWEEAVRMCVPSGTEEMNLAALAAGRGSVGPPEGDPTG